MNEIDIKTLVSRPDRIEEELKQICDYKRPSQVDDMHAEITAESDKEWMHTENDYSKIIEYPDFIHKGHRKSLSK